MFLTLPWPPSANRYYRHITRGKLAGRVLLSEHGRDYRKAVDAIVAEHKGRMGWSDRLRLYVMVYPPDNRKRDLDNLLKAVLDSLQAANVFLNDSQIDHLTISRTKNRPSGAIEVSVEQIGPADEFR